MRVIQLEDVLHEYLLQLIEKHAAQGIHPEEGLAVNRLWEAVTKRATHIPDEDIQKMAAAAMPEGQSSPAECEMCFNESGSLSCIRSAHKAVPVV